MTCPISQESDSYPQPRECIAYIRYTRISPNHWSKHNIPIEQTIKADGVSFLKNGHFRHNQVVIKAVFLAGTFQYMYFCLKFCLYTNYKLNLKVQQVILEPYSRFLSLIPRSLLWVGLDLPYWCMYVMWHMKAKSANKNKIVKIVQY